jgi:hypothetical protein
LQMAAQYACVGIFANICDSALCCRAWSFFFA